MVVKATYYRVLSDKCYVYHWERDEFTSSHLMPPGEWTALYNANERDPLKYPLEVLGCIYDPRARDAYLLYMPQYPDGRITDPNHRWHVGRVSGVFAFTNPRAAWDYGILVKSGEEMYAEFTGEFVSACAVEDDGVVVQPENQGRLFTREEFRAKCGF